VLGAIWDATDVPTDLAATLNASCSYVKARQVTMMTALMPAGARARVIAAGLRVNSIGNSSTATGSLEAFDTAKAIMTGAGAYESNANILGGGTALGNRIYSVTEGLTCRRRVFSPANWVALPADEHAAITWGAMPAIAFTGLSTTTVLAVEAITFYEVVVQPMTCPLPLEPSEPEDSFDQLVNFANVAVPLVTKGHSFGSILTAIAGAVGPMLMKGLPTVLKTIGVKDQAAKSVMNLMGHAGSVAKMVTPMVSRWADDYVKKRAKPAKKKQPKAKAAKSKKKQKPELVDLS